jgi:hypothetical protein
MSEGLVKLTVQDWGHLVNRADFHEWMDDEGLFEEFACIMELKFLDECGMVSVVMLDPDAPVPPDGPLPRMERVHQVSCLPPLKFRDDYIPEWMQAQLEGEACMLDPHGNGSLDS